MLANLFHSFIILYKRPHVKAASCAGRLFALEIQQAGFLLRKKLAGSLAVTGRWFQIKTMRYIPLNPSGSAEPPFSQKTTPGL